MSVIVEIVKIISPMVVAISAAATAFFAYKGASYAYKGLSIWREQHSGKIESDLATRLLASIYRYRDAIDEFMNPSMALFLDSAESTPHLTKDQRLSRARKNLKNEQYNKVISARQKFYDDILTSEAIWDEAMRTIVEEMYGMESIFLKRVVDRLIMTNPDIDYDKKETAKKSLKKLKMSDDELLEKFAELIKIAEDYLKPKIV